MLLRLEGVARSFGARVVFSDVSLAVFAGDRIGIVGPNGAGKTSLLHVAAGDEAPDAGRVVCARGVRVGMLRQEIDPRRQTSVRDEVASVLGHLDELEREMARLESEMTRCGREGREVPEELAAWARSLRADWEQKDASKKAKAAESPSAPAAVAVKKDKIQAGLNKAAIRAAQDGLPVFSVSSDVQGSTGISGFQKTFPDRFIEVGIAEANMVSVGAGLSKESGIPTFRVEDRSAPPPRFAVVRRSALFLPWNVYRRELDRWRWTELASGAPDVPFGNSPDPNHRFYPLGPRHPDLIVLERVGGDDDALRGRDPRGSLR